jgi:hypothetical protein
MTAIGSAFAVQVLHMAMIVLSREAMNEAEENLSRLYRRQRLNRL